MEEGEVIKSSGPREPDRASDKTLDESCWWQRAGKDHMDENKDAEVVVRRSRKNVADINDGIWGLAHSRAANAGSL